MIRNFVIEDNLSLLPSLFHFSSPSDQPENVNSILSEALKLAEITRLEIHGPEQELAKLREPLASLKPQFFTLEYGFRR